VEESLGHRQETTDKAVLILREGTKDLDISETLRDLESEMVMAAEKLEFEKAAHLRDQINQLKRGMGEDTIGPRRKMNYLQTKRGKSFKKG
jgi:excinuclease ABC subunit B